MLVTFWRARERALNSSEGGSTLVSVLIVMLVLTIGGLALSAVVVNTTGSLSSTSSRATAQATVDAGVAAQTVRLESGEQLCTSASQSGVNLAGAGGPKYNYTLECGGGVATLTVRSTYRGAEAARKTVFSYTVPPLVPKKEPALVTRAPLDLSSLTIKSVSASDPATVWVVPDAGATGDFSCVSGGKIAGSVYLPAGSVFGSGGCEVGGDVYAEGSISIGSGTTIKGNLVSLNGSVTITGGNSITGSIYAKNNVTGSGLSGNFVTSIHAGGNLNLAGGTPVARDKITYGGTFTFAYGTASQWAANSVTKAVVAPLPIPTAPQWEGVAQSDLDALVANGVFSKVTWSGGCTHTWNHPMKAIIEARATPTLIDARACSRVDLPGQWGDIKLKTDIIFVAPSFNLVGQNFVSGDAKAHRVWILSPEETNRNCSAVQPINVQGVKMSPIGNSLISGMIFSQCTVYFANASEEWQGSIHAGKMTGKPNFWYKPVGFPGKDDPSSGGSSGGSTTTPTTVTNLTVVSNGDVS